VKPTYKYPITLSVEDLVSSLKVLDISLNEHEPAKKSKSIESEEESPDGDSDDDPTEKMAMLSNKLEYQARKNRKFLSKKGGYKSSKKEYQKGCFNCRSLDISLLITLIFRRRNQRKSQRNQASTQENSGSRLRRV
jgi:hypothetical protein